MRAKRIRLTVGSTHTRLGPVTVYTVVEFRRVPNKRGTTSTVPVWRGCCKQCGAEFEQPRIIRPEIRRCDECRGRIRGIEDISPDPHINEHNEDEMVELAANAHRGRRADLVHEPAPNTTTKPVFTDR